MVGRGDRFTVPAFLEIRHDEAGAKGRFRTPFCSSLFVWKGIEGQVPCPILNSLPDKKGVYLVLMLPV